jgi:hypothetical protein
MTNSENKVLLPFKYYETQSYKINLSISNTDIKMFIITKIKGIYKLCNQL